MKTPAIGRNDPCPCGSGKKFKHCCMGKETTLYIWYAPLWRGVPKPERIILHETDQYSSMAPDLMIESLVMH